MLQLQKKQQKEQKNFPIIQKAIIYGVIDSQNLKLSEICKNQIKVGILHSYQFNDQLGQILENTQKQQNKYQIWIYPDGIKIYDSNYKILNDPQPEFSFFQSNTIHSLKMLKKIESTSQLEGPLDNIYSFVLTDYDLNRTYCTCLIWHEKKFVQNDLDQQENAELHEINKIQQRKNKKSQHQISKILPKCTLNQLIKDPLVLDPETSLVYIPKGLILCSRQPFLEFQKNMALFTYFNGIKKIQQATIRKDQLNKLKNLITKFGYPRAEQLFDQEQFLRQLQSRSKKIQKLNQLPIKPSKLRSKKTYEKFQRQELKNKFNLKNLRNIDKKKLQQFYLSFTFLPELIQLPSTNPDKNVQIVQIQDTINSVCKFDKLYFTSTCFKVPNIKILQTIQRIGIENLIILWKNAVLQRQILVFSSDLFFTIQLFETLLYILQPLKWQNIYIPFLPFHLCHHVQALGGYFIGMSKIHMNYMIEHFNLQTKVLVDLDQMIIIQEGGNNVNFYQYQRKLQNIEVPQKIKEWIIKSYQSLQLMDKSNYSNEKKSLWNFPISSFIPFHGESLSKSQLNHQQQKQKQQQRRINKIFQIHKFFFISLFYLINNYSSFIQEQQKGVRFNRDSYFQIFQNQSERKFAQQIVKTMMFVRVCQFHKNAQKQLKWNQQNICSLFVYCHYIMKQDSQNMDKRCWEVEQENKKASKMIEYVNYVVKKNLKQIFTGDSEFKVYKVEHYMTKYLNYLSFKNSSMMKNLIDSNQNKNNQGWLNWIFELIKKQAVQIASNDGQKKLKLNKAHDFWQGHKNIFNLKNLYGEIDYECSRQIYETWDNGDVFKNAKNIRDTVKSVKSTK